MNVRAVAVPVIAVGIALLVWQFRDGPGLSPVPSATWRVQIDDEYRQARNYGELAEETAVRLSFSCSEARHVYVFGHSRVDGTLLMFPSPELKSDLGNPVPAGHHTLPGTFDDKEVTWTTRAEILGLTTFVAVASAEPIADLEELSRSLRRWTNSVLPDQSLQITNPTSAAEVKGAPRTDWPNAILKRAAERSNNEVIVNGPMAPDEQLAGVWSCSVHVKEAVNPNAKKGGLNTRNLKPLDVTTSPNGQKPGGGK